MIKKHLLLSICGIVLLPMQAPAGLAVTDYLQILRNAQAAEREMIELILQGEQQFEQIQKLLRQIQQMDDYLERLGDPRNTSYLNDIQELLRFLESIGRGKTAGKIREGLKASELFQKRSGGVYPTIQEAIVIDGIKEGNIRADEFLPEVAARRTLDHSRRIQASTHHEREEVKQQLGQLIARSQTAKTSSELEKINTAISGLRIQLQLLDSEARQASRQVETNHYEHLVEARIARKARLQREREKIRVGTKKSANVFPMMNKPVLFRSLQQKNK